MPIPDMFNRLRCAGTRARQGGLSLVEAVIFIMAVGIGLTGILSAMTLVGRHSADPAIQRQELALAESLLNEIELQSFTTCDPAGPPLTTGGACVISQGLAPEAGETRYSSTTPFNNVGDYNGFSMTSGGGILAIDGTAIGGLSSYSASVAVTGNQSLGALPVADVLRIDVSVTGPDNSTIVLTGYRARDPQ